MDRAVGGGLPRVSIQNVLRIADHLSAAVFTSCRFIPCYLGLLLCLLLSPVVQAAVYKWVDEDGNVQFSDHPRGEDAQQIEIKQATPPPAQRVPKGMSTRFKSPDARLLEAVRNGDAREVKHAIEEGADVAGQEGKGRPAFIAIAKQQNESLKVLLDFGADANQTDTNGFSLLHMAARTGCAACAESLISQGAAVETQSESGLTPLAVAAESGHARTAEVLLRQGAEVDRLDFNGLSPLYHAVTESNRELVALLMAQGADHRLRATNGTSMLMAAAANGDEESLRLLLKRGARVDARDNWGSTPLLKAVANGNIRCVQLLLDAGAKVTARNAKRETALDIARSSFKLQLYPLLETAQ